MSCTVIYLLTKVDNGNLVGPLPTICCVVAWTAPTKKQVLKKAAFQFRDLRAKAATDTDAMHGIEAPRNILGHRNQNMTNEYIRRRLSKLVAPTKQQLKGLM